MTKAALRQVTQERLKALLSYDPETGVFRWRSARGGKLPGAEAGSICRARGKDYRRIRVDDELIMAHRLAWLYIHGVWPDDELDHDDGDGLNNAISNLVPASRTTNNRNASLRKDNRTGVPGVFQVRSGKYTTQIKHKGAMIWLGTFESLASAIDIRKSAEAQYHYHPQHGKAKKR